MRPSQVVGLYPIKPIPKGEEYKKRFARDEQRHHYIVRFCVQIIRSTNHEQMFASHEPTTSDILLDKKVAQA